MNEIPTDQKAYDKLVSQVQLRMLRAAIYSQSRREGWVRFYKIWRKIKDAFFDEDEPNIALGYAYGIVEQVTSALMEPIVSMGLPAKPMPLKLHDGNAADNFGQIARNFYSKPINQESLLRSCKEKVICGTRVEIDEWVNVVRKGKMWGKVPQEVEIEVVGPNGLPSGVKKKSIVMVDGEVERYIPIHKGFSTTYPSIFSVYFEPDRKTIGTGLKTDCTWVIEDMGELALKEMVKEKYIDPITGNPMPLYDFGKLLHDAGPYAEERYKKVLDGGEIDDSYGPLITPYRKWNYDSDFGRIDKASVYPQEGQVDRISTEDRDKVWVVRMLEDDQIVTIANGTYIIQRKKLPWHVPILPVRVDCYTIDPEFLYGYGAIEPVEDELNSLDDIKNLAFSNWIRIINKMIAIKEEAIYSMNDFKPRSGGKIRIRGDMPIGQAIMPIDQTDPSGSMALQESETKGNIEWTTGILDGSSGSSGTKQDHKTARGLQIIQSSLSVRRRTSIRQTLINCARQMQSMERFFSQFQFEKESFRIYRDDGSTVLAELNKDDIFTEGRGFEYLIEIDPNFGDTMAERQQNLFLLDKAMEYEKFRAETHDPEMRKADVSKMFEKVLMNFGYRDTSQIFSLSAHAETPENELQIIMQGGIVKSQDSEDRIHHVMTHLLQRDSPMLDKAIKAGKAHPESKNRLELHILETLAAIKTFISNPQFQVDQKKGMITGNLNGTK